jgi:hypothetical protein
MMASSDVYFDRNAGFVLSFTIGLISAWALTSAGAIAPIVSDIVISIPLCVSLPD